MTNICLQWSFFFLPNFLLFTVYSGWYMAKSGWIMKSEKSVCYSSWVVTGLSVAVDQNPQPPATCFCQLLHSYLDSQQKENKTCLLTKVILAFKQCQNMPVACMHVLPLCSGMWYRMNEEERIFSLWMLAARQSLSTTGIFRRNFFLHSDPQCSHQMAKGQWTGFSEYLTLIEIWRQWERDHHRLINILVWVFSSGLCKDFRG